MCDLLVALPCATGSHTLFAKNSDRPPDEVQIVEIVEPRTESSTRCTHIAVEPFDRPTLRCVISRPEWGWGAEHGVNEAGLALGNATIYTTLDPRPFPDALTGMDIVRLALERCANALDAVALITVLIETHGQGGSGHAPLSTRRPYWNSFLIADPTDAWVVETSGREWESRQVRDVWATSNRTTIDTFDVHRHPRQPVASLVDPRLGASREVLSTRPVTLDAIQRHLASHGMSEDGWDVCMHVDGVECTTASLIVELPHGSAPRVLMAQGSPCVTPYRRIHL